MLKQKTLFKEIIVHCDKLEKTEDLTVGIIVHCRVCGRVLKNSDSILEGIGPTCRENLMKKCPVRQMVFKELL